MEKFRYQLTSKEKNNNKWVKIRDCGGDMDCFSKVKTFGLFKWNNSGVYNKEDAIELSSSPIKDNPDSNLVCRPVEFYQSK
jgi:hypothetical protein